MVDWETECRAAWDHMKRLSAENRAAFMAGFDAGALDAAEGGQIICDDFLREVTEKAYKEWRDSVSTEQTQETPEQERCRHIGDTWTAGGQTYCDDCGVELL